VRRKLFCSKAKNAALENDGFSKAFSLDIRNDVLYKQQTREAVGD
jgi:hypothetical protein